MVGADDVMILVSNQVRFAPVSGSPSRGFGLIGLKERALSVRGDLSVKRSGDEFRLEARLPLPNGEDT